MRYFKMRTDRTDMQKRTSAFLTSTYLPAAKHAGAGPVGLFSALIAPSAPFILCLTSYPSLEVMQSVKEKLAASPDYQKALEEYNSGDPGFIRMESWLHRAFDFFPTVEIPETAAGAEKPKARMFELRTYESQSESTLRHKIKMFGSGEVGIFRRVGLQPVLFGEAIAGANLPHLSYMLAFENLAAREKNWAAFGADPEWVKLRSVPEFAAPGLVINISNSILNPLAGSEIR